MQVDAEASLGALLIDVRGSDHVHHGWDRLARDRVDRFGNRAHRKDVVPDAGERGCQIPEWTVRGLGRALGASDDLIASMLEGVGVARHGGLCQSTQLRLDGFEVIAHLEHLECEDAADDDGADQDQAEGAQGDPERPPSAAPARRPGFGRGVTGKRPRRSSPRPCVSPGHRGRGGDG